MLNIYKTHWWQRLQFKLSIIFIISFGLFIYLAYSLIQSNIGRAIEKKEWQNIELLNQAIIKELQQTTATAHSLAVSMATISMTHRGNIQQFSHSLKSLLMASPKQFLIAGGGIWPEPFLFNSQRQRHSFFWAKDRNQTLQFLDNYNNTGGMGYHHQAWYVPARYQKPGDIMWSGSYMDLYSLEPMVTCSVPIFKQQQFWGVSTVDINLSTLSDLVELSMNNYSSYVFVVDRNNKLITRLPSKITSPLTEFPTLTQLAFYDPAFVTINDATTTLSQQQIRQQTEQVFNPDLASLIQQDAHLISADEAKLISEIIQKTDAKNTVQNYPTTSFKLALASGINEQSLISISVMPQTQWKVINVKPYSQISAEVENEIKKLIIPIVVTALFSISFIYLFIHIFFIARVKKIAKQLELKNRNVTAAEITTEDKGELAAIVHLFNTHSRKLIFQQHALDQHAIVSITDAKGNITYANSKFEKISQYSQQELLGHNHRLLKSNAHSHDFFQDMWQTISSGKIWHGEIKNTAKDGSFYWVSSTILPYINKQGRVERYIAIRTDISHIKAMEVEQKQANLLLQTEKALTEQEKKKAQKANQAKSDFLSSMSHEVRTPMNAILGFAQLLESDEESPLTSEQQENVGFILSSGQHLLSLINNVLELSTIESGQLTLSIEAVPLADIINDSLSLLSPLSDKKNIQLKVLSSTNIMVYADYLKLKQVILNLVSNAIKYNQQGGTISIDWAYSAQDTIKVSIKDSGIGISAQNQHNVFSAFNRLGQENSSIEGTGIGLVVTKELLEIMDGAIGFSSIQGEGSTFWFELPVIEQQRVKHVLYIEDNSANRHFMQAVFNRQQDYDLSTADTGEQGWHMAQQRRYDLILMDLHLPGIDGKELSQKLRATQHYAKIPILAVSAAAMENDIAEASGLFDAYITKPVDISNLLTLLAHHLNRV